MREILILFFIGFVLGLVGLSILNGIFTAKNPISFEERIFSLEKGWGAEEIAINLENQGLIKDDMLFRIYVIAKGISSDLQAGDYLLSPSMNIPEIAQKLVSGDVYKIKVTIPEGFNNEQIDARLVEDGLIKKGEILAIAQQGFMFPDTYYFSLETTPQEINEIFQDNFNQKIDLELREEIANQNKSIFEVIIMASLIEREVRTVQDKKLVSGILWKRLAVNMLLQVDAAMVTYQKKGLPDEPICNPGLDSILAAVYPESSEYWFYLSAPDGQTIFSKTLAEHEANIEKYLNNKP